MGARIVIIGAGMGGLVSAALLAREGHDVTLLEKEDSLGGKARRVNVDGVEVAGGPTVFTMRDVFERVFAQCGERLDDYITASRAEVLARHAWDDREKLDLYADPLRSEDAIGDFAGKDAAAGYRRFREDARHMFETLDKPMLRGSKVSTPLPLMWRIGLWRMQDIAAIRPFDRMWDALGEYFTDPRLRQLFGRYATYCGSSPYNAPATLMLIAHVEAKGVWLLDGGIHSLAVALGRLAHNCGAKVRTGAAVAQINTSRKGVTGVRLVSGEQIEADAVICNADPAAIATGKFGVMPSKAVKPLAPSKRSLSAQVWFAHAKSSGFDLSHHNVLFSKDYQREFDEIAAGKPPSEPTVYVCAQDRTGRVADDAARASGERERIQIIVNTPANGDTHTYSDKEIEQCNSRMRASLEQCGLALEDPMPHHLATPAEWEALFPATGGALYGRASDGWAASFVRQGARTKIPGLYCAGGGTHPGAGVPMAALSGQSAAQTVSQDLASTRRFHRAATAGGMSMPSAKTDSMA